MNMYYNQGVMSAATSSEKSVMNKLVDLSQSISTAQRRGKMSGGMVPGNIMSQLHTLATPDNIATLQKLGMLNKLGPLAPVLMGMSRNNKGGKSTKKGGLFSALKRSGSSVGRGKGNNINLGPLYSLGAMMGGGAMGAMAGGLMGGKMPGFGARGADPVFNPSHGLNMQDVRGMATHSGNKGWGGPRATQAHRFDPSDGLDMNDARGLYDMYKGQSGGRPAGYGGQPDPRVYRGAPSGYESRGGPRFDMGDGLDMDDMQAMAGMARTGGGRY